MLLWLLLAHFSSLSRDGSPALQCMDRSPQPGVACGIPECGQWSGCSWEPGALLPFAFLSHSPALRNPWQKCKCPEPAGPTSSYISDVTTVPCSPTPDRSSHVTHSSEAVVGLEWLFLGMQAKQRWDSGLKPLQSRRALNKVGAPAQPTSTKLSYETKNKSPRGTSPA